MDHEAEEDVDRDQTEHLIDPEQNTSPPPADDSSVDPGTSAWDVPLPPASESDAEAPTPVWDPRTGTWMDGTTVEPVFAPSPTQPTKTRSPVLMAGVVGGVIGALLAAATFLALGALTAGPATDVPFERRLEGPVTARTDAGLSIVDIAERARPSVVNINITGRRASPLGSQVVQGTGSGVIIRSDGHILTNAHVVDGATEIEVTLASGERLPATLVGADRDTDIAVIRVDRSDLPPALIGSAKELRVGELAVAIGSPLGLEQTVTSGIISALGRRVNRPDQPPLIDMIQTDAPITQGNSGGALINGDGAVIGINTAIAASPQVGAEGIAFAIPIDIAMAVAEELAETGQATHPWLGITGGNITAETARQFGVEEGALIIEVMPGSPADTAGLQPQDVIVGFDGERIETMDELIVAIRSRKVGDEVRLDVVRDGQRLAIETTLGNRPSDL